MDIRNFPGGLILTGVPHFDPRAVFTSGQAFRYAEADDGGVTAVAFGRAVYVRRADDGSILLSGTGQGDFEAVWRAYFDLERDYAALHRELAAVPGMEEAAAFSRGLRILRQEPWETLVSFLLSQNNNIPRIRGSLEKIARALGEPILFRGETFYSFPEPACILSAGEEFLRACGCGYRSPYILAAAERVAGDGALLSRIGEMDTASAREALLSFRGVGPKVAECVLLYGYGRMECFPVDVWVARALGRRGEDDAFRRLGGLCQQMLFYYERETGRRAASGKSRSPSAG